jgi:hypothetical protein
MITDSEMIGYVQVERTLATVQLDKLPDGGGNLHARRQQLQHKLSEQERDEKADSLADEISSMSI